MFRPGSQQELKGYVPRRKRNIEAASTSKSVGHDSSSTLLSPYVTSGGGDPDTKKPKLKSSVPRTSEKLPSRHSKPVLSLEWHPLDHRLLISAGLDGEVVLWDVKKKDIVTSNNFHGGAGVRDVEWLSGEMILTAGYDCTTVQSDVGYGKEILRLKHESFVSVVKPNTVSGENLVLTGDSNGKLQMWDMRTGKVTKVFKGAGGKILDAAFLLPSKNAFIASSDIVRKNAFSQAINIWDITHGVTLTHQLYFEPFTCPCLRVHGDRGDLLAQSNGNYIVMFSPEKPFKLNKRKRFEGHFVSGFDVSFDLSPDMSLLCSASSEGKVHFYDYHSSRTIKTLDVSEAACLGVSWSPRLPASQVAISDWNGSLYVLN